MKIFLLSFVFILLFFVFIPGGMINAQNEVNDYQYQYEKYRDFSQNYLKAKESYLKYQTLTSQNEFIKSGREFLLSRSLTLRTYLQALKYLLRETADIDSQQKTSLTLLLDQEINWLIENENQIGTATTPDLNDLLELSARVEKKQDVFKKLAYQTLASTALGRMRSLQTEVIAVNFLLEDKINSDASGKDKELLNQWLQSARDKTYDGQKAVQKAEGYLLLLIKTSKGSEAVSHHAKVIQELTGARLFFIETVKLQQEIFREVKND